MSTTAPVLDGTVVVPVGAARALPAAIGAVAGSLAVRRSTDPYSGAALLRAAVVGLLAAALCAVLDGSRKHFDALP